MEVNGTAAIYCRISRDAEGERVGVERQEDDCRVLAARLGLEVTRTFIDNDTGASDRTRKSKIRHEYQAMLEAVQAGTVHHIVSYSNSRLTRRMRELEDLIKLHEQTGVLIHTVVSGQDDLSTADGRMVARIKASVDAAEAERISERSKAAFRTKAMTGEPRVTSNRPFGWLADGKTLDPVESRLIREGVLDLIRGVPVNAIRRRWMEEGVKTPAGGTEWHWTNICQVLTSWRAAGVRTYNKEVVRDINGEPVRGQWEPIITLEEREQALLQVASRKLTRRHHGKYLLTGLLRCGEPDCGRPLWGNVTSTEGRSTQYACSSRTRHVSIDAKRLEEHVLLELVAHLTNHAIFTHGSPESSGSVAPQEWSEEHELVGTLRRIEKLTSEYETGRVSDEVFFPTIQRLEARRDGLRRERETFLAENTEPVRQINSIDDLNKFLEQTYKLPASELQLLLQEEAHTILIYKGVRGVAARDPEVFAKRVKIVWKSVAVPYPRQLG